MEVKKIAKTEPKYPSFSIGAKIGIAAAAVGLMAGVLGGCSPAKTIGEVVNGVVGKVEIPDDEISYDGGLSEYVEPDEQELTILGDVAYVPDISDSDVN